MNDETPTIIRTQARPGQVSPAAAGVANSIFAAARPKGGPGSRGPRLFDVAAVKIETGVPVPPKIGGVGGISQYAALASRMKPGSVAWLDTKRAYGLKVWFRKAGKHAEVRKLADGRIGCWLLADEKPPPKAAAAKKAAPAGKGGKR
jgi:hypothetical protein